MPLYNVVVAHKQDGTSQVRQVVADDLCGALSKCFTRTEVLNVLLSTAIIKENIMSARGTYLHVTIFDAAVDATSITLATIDLVPNETH